MFLSLVLLFVTTKAGTPCTSATEADVCDGYACNEERCAYFCNAALGCSTDFFCTSTDSIYGECEQDTGECTANTDNCLSGVCLIESNRNSGTCAECATENQATDCGENVACVVEEGAAGGVCAECTADDAATNCGDNVACILGTGQVSGVCGCHADDCCNERVITFSNYFDSVSNDACKLCICDVYGTECVTGSHYQNEWKKGYVDSYCGDLPCEFDDYIFPDVTAQQTGEAICCPRCIAINCDLDEHCDRGYACNTTSNTCFTECNDGGCATGYGCRWGQCKAYECTAANQESNCEQIGVCALTDDSGSGFCCDEEAKVYRINYGEVSQCKLHYCKQNGGDQYVKDDVYSTVTETDENASEYLTYLRKACPEVAECVRDDLVYPTFTETSDDCCPVCKDCTDDAGCVDGKECYNEVCIETCDDDETRSESGECVCTSSNQESVNGVCVAVCGEGTSRDADGNCATVCTIEGGECTEDGDECVDEICQTTCTISGDGDTYTCDVDTECVDGVCREECEDNESRNDDGDCGCTDDGEICDDDQTCEGGSCVSDVSEPGDASSYRLSVLVVFVFAMLLRM